MIKDNIRIDRLKINCQEDMISFSLLNRIHTLDFEFPMDSFPLFNFELLKHPPKTIWFYYPDDAEKIDEYVKRHPDIRVGYSGPLNQHLSFAR